MSLPGTIVIQPAARFAGRLHVPGDKSISHRYALLAGLSGGRSVLHGFSPGADCHATLGCLQSLGVDVRLCGSVLTIMGRGLRQLSSTASPLQAGNSGTTARLLAGVLAAHDFVTTIVGDGSLARRPMQRVAAPLREMGARIGLQDGRLPMTISGGRLHGIDFVAPVPSAQVKSAVLLAGLQAEGRTAVTESAPTRNHTELALRLFGANPTQDGATVTIEGGQPLVPVEAVIPGDMSSAAFWLVSAAGIRGGEVEIERVGLNPTRTAVLNILRRAGAEVEAEEGVNSASIPWGKGLEPAGRLRVRHRDLVPFEIRPDEVSGLIDEIPALAALATFGCELTVSGASELRVKESDRITALVTGLRGLGAEAEEWPDGFHVNGVSQLRGGAADAAGDHRLAMAFAVAALGAAGPSVVSGAESVDVSYPGFFEVLASLAAR